MGCSHGNFFLVELILRNTGQSYDGYWKEGAQHGIGKMISKDGSSKQGRWENGQNAEWFNSTHLTPQQTGQNTPNFNQGGNFNANVNNTTPGNYQNQSNFTPNQGNQASNFNPAQQGNKNVSGFNGR